MKKDKFAWITGGDEKYLEMIEVLAKSLLHYSSYKLIVYGFNCDSNINLPNVINRRVNFNQHKKEDINCYTNNGEFDLRDKDYSIYFAKFLANINSLNENYDKFAWIDGDAFVTSNIDKSLKYLDGLDDYPLFMRYFHHTTHNWKMVNKIKLEGQYGTELANIKNITRNPNDRIVAAGFYFYDRRSISFFQKCLKWNDELNHHSIKIWVDENAFSEERVANCILWEEGKDKYLPITWNNFYSPNEDIKVKNRYYLEKGWDNMFDEVTNEVLFIHGPDPSVTPKNAEVLNKAFNDYKSTKLMIIAHPDDELIFGGVELIYYGEDYKVVCVTNPKNKDRVLEFEKVMKRLKICSWEMLDYKDTLYPTQTYYKLDDIINSRKWDKIVTHNPVGEYGHPQHKLIHDRVKSLTSDFYVFGKSPIKIEKIILDIKLELLKLYKSGEDIVNMLLNNNGKWFTSKDPTTNYVEYESISKYNIKQDNTSYIHCYDK